MLIKAHNPLCSRHPLQEIRKHIRHTNKRILALTAQITGHAQRRAYCISIGTAMSANYNMLTLINQALQAIYLFNCQNIYFHMECKGTKFQR